VGIKDTLHLQEQVNSSNGSMNDGVLGIDQVWDVPG